jgi:hypothetical protein
MGAPVSIHEEEITTRDPLPQPHLRSPGALIQCVKMARLMAIVLSREGGRSSTNCCHANDFAEVYGTKSHDRSFFVRSIRRVLQGSVETLESMPPEHKLDLESSTWHVSRTSATLYLFTYQVST